MNGAVSEVNSQKLDRLLLLMEGDGKQLVGYGQRLTAIEMILFGKDGKPGLIQEHYVMWRAHVWALCTLSGAIGVIGTLLVQKIFKLL